MTAALLASMGGRVRRRGLPHDLYRPALASLGSVPKAKRSLARLRTRAIGNRATGTVLFGEGRGL